MRNTRRGGCEQEQGTRDEPGHEHSNSVVSGHHKVGARESRWPYSRLSFQNAAITPSPAPTDFTGRVAIVTGAARGLGRAAATRLYERGASVAVNVRDAERAEAVATSFGDRALAVPGDITGTGVPEEIVQRTLDRFGRVDILVNNAAYARSTRFADLSPEEWRDALEVNLTAPFLLMKAVLPAMRAQQYGRIVNISSVAGRMVSTLGGPHYTATKTGLLGLTRAAASELGRFGITVNAVCPGMIDTELTREHATPDALAKYAASYPVPRLGTAAEVADLICFAASEAAGYITGASLDINGGDLMM
jgi:NAD(P)-dependent dehydrogenase (short-subunit alcohol dehydrogenase family)